MSCGILNLDESETELRDMCRDSSINYYFSKISADFIPYIQSIKMKSKLKLPRQPPASSKIIGSTNRKRRMLSQQTIDTNITQPEQMMDRTKINQEQIMNEIKLTLYMIDGYKSQIMRNKGDRSLNEQLEIKHMKIENYQKQIRNIQEEIARLKQVYNRPKVSAPASRYTQLHLKTFTLADQIAKQRQHLNLHITHHRNLKNKAKQLHYKLKDILPLYIAKQKQRGFKPMSYGQFRKKKIVQKKQNLIKFKIRAISERSLSRRSSRSVKSIIQGNSSLEVSEEKKNLWYMQKRKRVASQAYIVSKQKHNKQMQTLQDQLRFLRDQDAGLRRKIEQLNKQLGSCNDQLSQLVSRRVSKLNE